MIGQSCGGSEMHKNPADLELRLNTHEIPEWGKYDFSDMLVPDGLV